MLGGYILYQGDDQRFEERVRIDYLLKDAEASWEPREWLEEVVGGSGWRKWLEEVVGG
jgi:hypothetical protein